MIPTQNNLNEIAAAITSNMDVTKQVLDSAIKAITTIGKKADGADIKSAEKPLKNMKSALISYIDVVKSVISILTSDIPQGKTLADIAGYVSKIEEDPDNPNLKKTVEKYTAIEVVMQIPNVINGMISTMQKLTSFKTGFRQIITMKKNILALGMMIEDLFTSFISMLKNIVTKNDLKEIMDCLVKQPDVIDEWTSNKTTQESEFKSKSKSGSHKHTVQGKLGLLDVFAQTFSIIEKMTAMNPPSLIKFELKLLKTRFALKRLVHHLLKFGKGYATADSKQTIEDIAELIAGDGNDNGKMGINKMLQKISMLTHTLSNIKFNLLHVLRINILLRFLGGKDGKGGLLNNLKNILQSDSIDVITDKDTDRKFKNLGNTINTLKEIGVSLMQLGVFAFVVNRFRKPIKTFISFIPKIVEELNNELFNKEINKSTVETLDDLNEVILSMSKIAKNIILLAILAIPAIISMIAAYIFIAALMLFIDLTMVLLQLIPTVVVKKINDGLVDIASIFISLVVVAASILILGLIAPLALKNILTTMGFVLVLMIFVGAIALLGLALDFIFNKMKMGNKITYGALMMLVVMGLLMVVAVQLLIMAVIAKTLQKMDVVVPMLCMFGAIMAFVGALVGLGYLMMNPIVLAGLGGAIIGTAMLFTGISFITGIANKMLELTKIDLDKLGIKKGKNGKFEFSDIKGTAIYNAKAVVAAATEVLNTLSDDIATRKGKVKARRSNKTLKQVNKVVNTITKIAEKLNKLQNVQIDATKLLGSNNKNGVVVGGSIGTIFSTIDQIENALIKFNSGAGNGATVRRDAIKAKRRLRRNKKVLSKVDRVINKIVDIAEDLESIGKFTIEADSINKGITNIFDAIEKVDNYIKERNRVAKLDDNGNVIDTSIISRIRQKKKARKQKQIDNQNAKSMSKVDVIMNSVAGIVGALESIKEFKLVDSNNKPITEQDLKNKIGVIFSSINAVSTEINEKIKTAPNADNVENMQPIIDYISNLGDSTKNLAEVDGKKLDKNIKSYVNFINKVNTMDVDKVRATSYMFRQMSNFSESIKGDFEKLAETLGDKLLPVLEELKEVMGVLPEKIDTGFQNTSASIAATTAPPTTENITAQINRENPNLSKDETDKMVNNRMSEKAKIESTGVAAKLDQLISLLKGYGETVVVRTV